VQVDMALFCGQQKIAADISAFSAELKNKVVDTLGSLCYIVRN